MNHPTVKVKCPWRDGEPIQIPAPSVPADDQGADNAPVVVRHEQRLGVASDEPMDVLGPIVDRGVLDHLAPQPEDRFGVRDRGRPDQRRAPMPRWIIQTFGS